MILSPRRAAALATLGIALLVVTASGAPLRAGSMRDHAAVCYRDALRHHAPAKSVDLRRVVETCLADPGAAEALPEPLSDLLAKPGRTGDPASQHTAEG